MKTFRILITMFTAILAAGLLAGCSDENVQYIQGDWAIGDVHYYSEWIFDRGSFIRQATITTGGSNLYQTGSYRILESKDNLLVLELYNIIGGDVFDDPTEIAIIIDREADSLRIGRANYYRVLDRSLEEVNEQTAP